MAELVLHTAVLRYVATRAGAGHIGTNSAKTYRKTLLGFARFAGPQREVRRIGRRDVERYLMAQRLAPATARARLSALRGFFRWCVAEGHTRADPTSTLTPPRAPRRLPRGLQPDQVQVIFGHTADERDVLMVLLMVQEGLRAVEVSRLQVGDIDARERTMVVRGKGGHERILPVSDETWSAMETYLRGPLTCATQGPLVRSKADGISPLKAETVSLRVCRAMQSAGVGGSPHRLRHTAAHDMFDRGANVREVQAALGHASLATTQIYLPLRNGVELRGVMGGRRYRREAS